jgi:hypothetical protein
MQRERAAPRSKEGRLLVAHIALPIAGMARQLGWFFACHAVGVAASPPPTAVDGQKDFKAQPLPVGRVKRIMKAECDVPVC